VKGCRRFGLGCRRGGYQRSGARLMETLAGRIMLLWGWRAYGLAFLAGAVAVLGLPPFDFFVAPFVSFPILVWLLDGASGNPRSGPIGRARPAFAIGWWFGFGYFRRWPLVARQRADGRGRCFRLGHTLGPCSVCPPSSPSSSAWRP
jgi:hypothetical protein